MSRGIFYILELVGLAGLITLLVFINWTKMLLGAVLTVIGAFFPKTTADASKGRGEVTMRGAKALVNGSLRVGLVIGGIILLLGAVLDGYSNKEKSEDEERKKESVKQKENRDRTLMELLKNLEEGKRLNKGTRPSVGDQEGVNKKEIEEEEFKKRVEILREYLEYNGNSVKAKNNNEKKSQ